LRRVFATAAVAALAIALLVADGCLAKKSGDDRRPACAHHRPPPPPDVTDGGGSYDLLFVASGYQTGTESWDDAGRPQYQSIGFDLDDTCTGEGEDASCVEPVSADGGHTDGVDGIDNAFGQIWWHKATGSDHALTTANTPAMMIRVAAYSGQPDDDQVEVSLYVGRYAAPGDGGSEPLWDGHDRWNLLRDMLAPSGDGGAPSPDEPRYRDDHAYVSRGVLVAQFPEAQWTPALANVPNALYQVHGVVLAGSLTRVGAGWELQNVMAGGRTALPDVFLVAAEFPDLLDGMTVPTCQVPADYVKEKQNTCPLVDIASVSDSPLAPCDAVSWGLLFQFKQAAFGEVLSPSVSSLDCPPGIDPEHDTCEVSASD
jgi:hypothetical protein